MSASLALYPDEVGGPPLGRLPEKHLPSAEDRPDEKQREITPAQYLMVDGIKLQIRSSQGHTQKTRADLFKMMRYNLEDIDRKDLLHLFMTYVVPEELAEPCSVSLLDRFASLGNMLAASWQRLEEASEHADGLAGPLKMLHAIVLAVLREPLMERPVFDSWAKLKDYLRVSLGHIRVEMVRVLYLDEHQRLIKDEWHSQGTVAHAPLEPYETARRAIRLGARSIILVHNHPTGDVMPSQKDKLMTLRLRDFFQRFGLVLQDHVIVGRSGCVSLRQLRYL
jgi:DNA repair protein RadC